MTVTSSEPFFKNTTKVAFSDPGSIILDAQLQEIISLWHKIPGEARGSAYVMIKGMLIAAQQLPQK